MPTRKIDLNLASAEELEDIEGIDSETANAIVRRREELGQFRRWLDVELTPGLDEEVMAQLREYALLGEHWEPEPLEVPTQSGVGAVR
jgi:competence ComEA-like helix-hairpin-helix protein